MIACLIIMDRLRRVTVKDRSTTGTNTLNRRTVAVAATSGDHVSCKTREGQRQNEQKAC